MQTISFFSNFAQDKKEGKLSLIASTLPTLTDKGDHKHYQCYQQYDNVQYHPDLFELVL